jgi:hypothetical protein
MEWRQWQAPAGSLEPIYRAFHTLVLYGTHVILYGGAFCNGGPYKYTNDEWSWSVEHETWSRLGIVKRHHRPQPRSQHSACIIGHNMVIYGGSDGTTVFNDVHILDLHTRQWWPLLCHGPAPRATYNMQPKDFRIHPARRAIAHRGTSLIVIDNDVPTSAYQRQPVNVHVLDCSDITAATSTVAGARARWSIAQVMGDTPLRFDGRQLVSTELINNHMVYISIVCQ